MRSIRVPVRDLALDLGSGPLNIWVGRICFGFTGYSSGQFRFYIE